MPREDKLDLTAKLMVRAAGVALARRLLPGVSVKRVAARESELALRGRRLDKVLSVEGTPPLALHLEIQATPRSNVPPRVFEYHALVRQRHRRVVTVVLYLKPDPRRGPPRDTYSEDVLGLTRLDFRFHAVCAWELDAAELLASGDPASLVLVPFARGASEKAVARALDGLGLVQPGERRADLQAALATFAGHVFPRVDWLSMIPEEIQMRSTFLDAVRREVETKTRAKVRAETRVEARAEDVIRILSRRFDRVPRAVRAEVSSQKSLPILDRLLDRAVDAASLADFVKALSASPAPRRARRR